MASSDVHDILNLQGDAAPRPAKKQKIGAPRPVLKGLAREVQNLGGDNPIAIVPEVTTFKKKRFGSRKPATKWELKPFKNSARDDKNLVLRHWRQKGEIVSASNGDDTKMEGSQERVEAEIEDSTFAKYNVHVSTPDYSDEQYTSQLQSATWSKSETDYLMQLVKEFDLRWPIIWDRYDYQPPSSEVNPEVAENAIAVIPPPRSMEDMKSRYYSIAAAMLRIQKPVETMNASEFNFLELLQGFNPAQETARKKYAEAQFHRSKEEAREEESLLVELKRILARSEKLSEERRELYARLDAPTSTGNISIYTSSQGLNQLVQQLAQVDKSKRKSLVGREGISPAGPGGINPQGNFDRRDSTVRESISGPSGGNNKKGSVQTPSDRRQLSEQEEQLYGIRRFERITTTGPAFRHEKIMKPITSKSSIQQQKIHNVLTELRVPSRLLMPTFRVGELFEDLVQNILGLIEQRKIADKLQGEINLIKQVKEEKAKAARAERGEPEPGDANGEDAGETGGAEVKVEDQDAREKSAAPSVSGVAAHKRSASVLSAVSDKSTKRQKK